MLKSPPGISEAQPSVAVVKIVIGAASVYPNRLSATIVLNTREEAGPGLPCGDPGLPHILGPFQWG